MASYAQRYLRPEAAWAAFADLAAKPSLESVCEKPHDVEHIVPRTIKARRQAPTGALEFCVVDVETTGFSSRLGDRVIEIATVRMLADGTILDAWSTLVDPERDIRGTHIHGIAPLEVVGAPPFLEIAGDLLQRLDGAGGVAHNLRFVGGFLVAEYERTGHRLSSQPGLCTIALGAQALPDFTDRRLVGYCERFGIDLPAAHTASGDAQATAKVLTACLAHAWGGETPSLEALGCDPLTWPASMPAIAATGRVQRRRSPERLDRQTHLHTGLAGLGEIDPDRSAYLQLLDRALEDWQLTDLEAEELCVTAESWNIDAASLHGVHRHYLETLVEAARAGGRVSDTARADLERVARLLDLNVLDEPLDPS